MTTERYESVDVDVQATRERWLKDPAFAEAYHALADEYAALGELLRARQRAGMTQADVAKRMGVAQAAVARMESSAGSRKHAPSLATLRRYADAVGCTLTIALAPTGAFKDKAKPKVARGVKVKVKAAKATSTKRAKPRKASGASR